MGEHDETGSNDLPNEDVRTNQAATRLHIYPDDRQLIGAFPVPVFRHEDNPHERLYVASFDGTGNDKIHDPEHETNVGLISDQLEALNKAGQNRIVGGYVEGPGTQPNVLTRTLDGISGQTVDERAEQMYKLFIRQAAEWQKEDPDAQIRVAGIGFSRGGEEAALFARLVDERGIQDPDGARYTIDTHSQIKHVEYTKPPLVVPGQAAQAIALFDPVGTGHAMHEDRRLPPSVISGIQLTAMDEHRGLFKSDQIIDPGVTPDGRFAGLYVPGAHSDVGGGYYRNGLSIRAGNLAIDYLNGLSDRPFLEKTREPEDPRLNVIHRSTEGMLIYRIGHKIDRLQPGGYNDLEVPKRGIGKVADPYNAEPRDEALNARFERQHMSNGLLPPTIEPSRDANEHVLSMQVDRMLAAAQTGDWASFRHDTQTFAAMDPGRDLHANANATVNGLEQAVIQQAAQQQSMQPAMEIRGPVR